MLDFNREKKMFLRAGADTIASMNQHHDEFAIFKTRNKAARLR
jgi:alpha-L-fucosidase